jgi:hypothetical protein
MRYEVDVSAFFAFQVDAASADEAAAIAREFVREAMTATPHTIEGYNSASGVQIVPAEIVPGVESADVEGAEL